NQGQPIPATATAGSRIAVGIRRAVAAFEPHLMRQMRCGPVDEEIAVKRNAAVRSSIELHHPALEPVGIELRIDRAVERVGEIDALAVTADLDHLWAAIEGAISLGMARTRNNAADPHLAGELGIEGIGDVILVEIAGSPAG